MKGHELNVFGAHTPPCVIIDVATDHVDAVKATVSRYAEAILDGIVPEPRWQSWDALVAVGTDTPPVADGLRMIQVGGEAAGNFVKEWPGGRTAYYRPIRFQTPGHELVIPSTLSEARQEFVKRYLIPALPQHPPGRKVFEIPHGASDETWTPLLTNVDGEAVAMVYRPYEGPLEVWYLPEEAIDFLDAALHLAFEEWHDQAPDRFPSSPDWDSGPRWMSARQEQQLNVVNANIDEARIQIVNLTANIEAGEVEREALIRAASQSYQRRLLTEHGDALVAAVTQALTELGFHVVDLDEQLAVGEPRLGDLAVSDETWTAVTEVKGYTKGAKSNDLMAVAKHRRIYEKTHGEVQRMWYIANTFRLNSPDSRPPILDGADDHVEDFGGDEGLAIDSRGLFDLLKQVELDLLSPEAARESLKNATGRFEIPTLPEPSGGG
ncbi:hypothetical protein [Nocardia sp. XZ_19_231]|uniref:hypothetical protein n=1 Tax=Nocardia sp. XZ_19_231 TaxID=2769252 RepID=UPI00188ED59E|nr:hypothetical protein [Nocardia sp. XZ_19_231]